MDYTIFNTSLIIICVILVILMVIITKIKKKQENEDKEFLKLKESIDSNNNISNTPIQSIKKEVSDSALVATISAAICSYLNTSSDKISIKKIQKSTNEICARTIKKRR
ncbi:MAG: hypothetical protein Q4F88_06245 [Eubacteriales bacterium]|nr:hypothetical protein [Eubacteriales bacterium]